MSCGRARRPDPAGCGKKHARKRPWTITIVDDPMNHAPAGLRSRPVQVRFGAILGIMACSVPFIALVLWPFLDRSRFGERT